MNNIKYRQCMLQREHRITTSWIPEKYAVLGKHLSIENNGEWEDGWVVGLVSNNTQDHDDTISHSQDYKKTRDASDI